MKLAIIGVGVLGTAIGWAPLASAAEDDWYVSAFGGGMLMEDSQNLGNDDPLNFTSSYKVGYAGRAAIGTYRVPQVRTELEISYRTVQFEQASFNSSGLATPGGGTTLNNATVPASGRFNAISGMLNAYYDYDTGSPWRPYIDAGFGTAWLYAHRLAAAGVPVVNASDLVFAYQFGLGIGYEVTKTITLALDYRYFTTLDPTFKDAAGQSFNSEFTSHALSLGIRYRF
jgi:OmpA-OmpF porin, OOP family